ncbi:hypothetical protein BJ742DRAFT_783026 [Cladochytrium replicatum]|nr:hypothetical protein BJ742DRAFT_783026 [Cladochytrium replicatum]
MTSAQLQSWRTSPSYLPLMELLSSRPGLTEKLRNGIQGFRKLHRTMRLVAHSSVPCPNYQYLLCLLMKAEVDGRPRPPPSFTRATTLAAEYGEPAPSVVSLSSVLTDLASYAAPFPEQEVADGGKLVRLSHTLELVTDHGQLWIKLVSLQSLRKKAARNRLLCCWYVDSDDEGEEEKDEDDDGSSAGDDGDETPPRIPTLPPLFNRKMADSRILKPGATDEDYEYHVLSHLCDGLLRAAKEKTGRFQMRPDIWIYIYDVRPVEDSTRQDDEEGEGAPAEQPAASFGFSGKVDDGANDFENDIEQDDDSPAHDEEFRGNKRNSEVLCTLDEFEEGTMGKLQSWSDALYPYGIRIGVVSVELADESKEPEPNEPPTDALKKVQLALRPVTVSDEVKDTWKQRFGSDDGLSPGTLTKASSSSGLNTPGEESNPNDLGGWMIGLPIKVRGLNLDVSTLMDLVSDIAHATRDTPPPPFNERRHEYTRVIHDPFVPKVQALFSAIRARHVDRLKRRREAASNGEDTYDENDNVEEGTGVYVTRSAYEHFIGIASVVSSPTERERMESVLETYGITLVESEPSQRVSDVWNLCRKLRLEDKEDEAKWMAAKNAAESTDSSTPSNPKKRRRPRCHPNTNKCPSTCPRTWMAPWLLKVHADVVGTSDSKGWITMTSNTRLISSVAQMVRDYSAWSILVKNGSLSGVQGTVAGGISFSGGSGRAVQHSTYLQIPKLRRWVQTPVVTKDEGENGEGSAKHQKGKRTGEAEDDSSALPVGLITTHFRFNHFISGFAGLVHDSFSVGAYRAIPPEQVAKIKELRGSNRRHWGLVPTTPKANEA